MKELLKRALVGSICVMGAGPIAMAGEAYKITQTYTAKYAPVPVSKRVDVLCASSMVGGLEIEGPKITFYYNAINDEWCRASHACSKTFDEIAKRSCIDFSAVGK